MPKDKAKSKYHWFKGRFSNADNQPDGNPQMQVYLGGTVWEFLHDMLDGAWDLVVITHTDPMREPGKFMVLLKGKE